MSSDERERFLDSEIDSFSDDPPADLGVSWITVHAEETVTCWTEWGGWHWEAEGTDRHQAYRRLTTRLMHMNPWDGSGWGDPGYQTDPLDDRIPDAMRKRMREFSREQGHVIPEDQS